MTRVCKGCLTAHDDDYTSDACKWCGRWLGDQKNIRVVLDWRDALMDKMDREMDEGKTKSIDEFTKEWDEAMDHNPPPISYREQYERVLEQYAHKPCPAGREIYGVTNTAYCQLMEGHAGEHKFEEYTERKVSNPFPKPCPSEVEIEPGGGTLPCVFDEHHLGPHEHGSIVWTDDESSAGTAALPNPRDEE